MCPSTDLSDQLTTQLTTLCSAAGLIASDGSLTTTVASLESSAVVNLARLATELGHAAERIGLAAAGVISVRSTRAAGHSGLAQQLGHRNAASLMQHVTGSTRGEAARQVRVGESLFDEAQPAHSVTPPDSTDPLGTSPVAPRTLWHAPLRAALLGGALTSAQHDAIKRGLGEPPTDFNTDTNLATNHGNNNQATTQAAIEAWSLAADSLIAEATLVTVEELAKQARAIRDIIDPEGADARYLGRYAARSFRMWTDQDGLAHGKFVFDDESAAWIRGVIDTALRPRRGGPRFIDPTQQAAADNLVNDPRSNEQLAHDLLVDVLKAGTIADAETVLGARQAGVRIVQIVDRNAYEKANHAGQHGAVSGTITRFEDDCATLPASVAAQQQCNSGSVPVTVDRHGNPLNVGREQRLYTPKQRIALAIRDGGCRWAGCDRPASYCEAHHIDEWSADHGRTDIDRGILLCRFHHMQLHNNGWHITRDGLNEFQLHAPPDSPEPSRAPAPSRTPVSSKVPASSERSRSSASPGSPDQAQTTTPMSTTLPATELRAPLLLRYAWQHATPPPKRFRQIALVHAIHS
ncbi:MAG: DUF222 domain-containing protein [Leucobacter sp.]